jgi:tripartite-type tricarboxylate transporter receptor subunit TctC
MRTLRNRQSGATNRKLDLSGLADHGRGRSKGFNLDAWAGLVAPAGTPAAVVQKLNTALREIIDSPDVQARFKNVGFEGFSSTPEELGAFIKVQLGVWEKMVKDADIKPN